MRGRIVCDAFGCLSCMQGRSQLGNAHSLRAERSFALGMGISQKLLNLISHGWHSLPVSDEVLLQLACLRCKALVDRTVSVALTVQNLDYCFVKVPTGAFSDTASVVRHSMRRA